MTFWVGKAPSASNLRLFEAPAGGEALKTSKTGKAVLFHPGPGRR